MPSSSDLMRFKQQQYYCGITGPTGKTGQIGNTGPTGSTGIQGSEPIAHL